MKRFFSTIICLAISAHSVCLVATTKGDESENWPRFRGINGGGVSQSQSVPSEWSERDYLWVTQLPGSGHSSPVIWNQSLFITAADDQTSRRWLICLSTVDGSERWRAESRFEPYKMHKNNSFASSTPAVDAERVYQLWHAKEQTDLIAYDHSGNEVWRYPLGPYLHGQGGATSPIVAGELVIVAHDHKDDSFLLAVDRKTGGQRWKIPREGKRACYSTPCVRTTANGKPEVVFVHCYEGIVGADAQTGIQNWHVDPFGRDSQRALISPIIAGDLVIAGSGAAGGKRQIVAIKVVEAGTQATASEFYRWERQAPHVPTPLAIDDRLYFWNDGGIASCCDLVTGEVIWQKRVGGTFFASPIAIGNRIFSIDTSGEVVVLAAADQFQVIARNPMGQSSRATLAASDGVLFVRTDSKVTAIGSRP